MNLQDLEVFMQIATLGGFNRAASHLHVVQSALSRRIARLEHEIGTPLFIRCKQGVQLTPAGSILLDKSQNLLRHFEDVEAEIKATINEPQGEVALGWPPSLLRKASAVLAMLRSRHSRLFMRNWVATSVELRGMLLSGKLDVAVYASMEKDSLLATSELFSEPLYLIGRKGDANFRNPDWKTIAELPLVLTSRPNGVRLMVEIEAAKRKVKPQIILEVNDISLILCLIEQGTGYTILPASAIQPENDRQLVIHQVPGLTLSWVVARSKDRPLSSGAKATIVMIEEIMGPAPPVRTARTTKTKSNT